jgi:hypothetical protein
MMRGWVFLLISVVAMAVGGTLFYYGYPASSATITVTQTQSFMPTTTLTNSSVIISTVTTQTTNENEVLDRTLSIPPPSPSYGCVYDDSINTTLDKGVITVTFSAGSDPVDFWIFNAQQHKSWVALGTCTALESVAGTVFRWGANRWETTVYIPVTDLYYFVFMNSNSHTVSISLTVSVQSATQTTEVLTAANYVTTTSTWLTQTSAENPQPAGLFLFSSVTLLIIGAVALRFFFVRSRDEEGDGGGVTREIDEDTVASAAAFSVPVAETKPKAETPVSAIYCGECGAKIPLDAKFCINCGAKVNS